MEHWSQATNTGRGDSIKNYGFAGYSDSGRGVEPNSTLRITESGQSIQHTFQPSECPHVAIAGGLIGDPQNLSRFAIGQLFEVPQRQNLAVDFVHPRKCCLELVGEFLAQSCLRR